MTEGSAAPATGMVIPMTKRLALLFAATMVTGVWLAGCTSSPATTAPPAKGLSVTLGQAEAFYNARGAESRDWGQGQSINGPDCSPLCGERNEDGGTGTGCSVQIIGPVGDVARISIACGAGQKLSPNSKKTLTVPVMSALLGATVGRFAPFAASWANQELNVALQGVKVVSVSHSDAAEAVDISASRKAAALSIQAR